MLGIKTCIRFKVIANQTIFRSIHMATIKLQLKNEILQSSFLLRNHSLDSIKTCVHF